MDRRELGRLLNLSIQLIPNGRPNRSGRPIRPQFITIHNTSNPRRGADAAAHSRFLRNTGFYILPSGRRNFVSWHFTVDDRQSIKHLPINEHAIHAGSGNGVSIGIEICMHEGIDQDAADLRAQWLTAALMYDLGLSPDHVRPHKHWTGKHCPTLLLNRFADFQEETDRFSRRLRDEAVGVEEEGPRPEGGLVTSAELTAMFSEAPPIEEAEAEPENEHELIAQQVRRKSRASRGFARCLALRAKLPPNAPAFARSSLSPRRAS